MPKLFVIMPFGVKDVADRTVDFDRIYGEMIRPAAHAADWTVLRIDEVVATGAITEDYLKELLVADLVLADISAPNPNVFYELGIRHAISPRGTLLVAQTSTAIPFDISGLRVLFYDDTASGWREGEEAIRTALTHHSDVPAGNPTWRFLQSVSIVPNPATDPLAFERDLEARTERARTPTELLAVWELARSLSHLPARPLRGLAERLANEGDWATAAEILWRVADADPEDFRVHRQLGWYLCHLGHEHDGDALAALQRALS